MDAKLVRVRDGSELSEGAVRAYVESALLLAQTRGLVRENGKLDGYKLMRQVMDELALPSSPRNCEAIAPIVHEYRRQWNARQAKRLNRERLTQAKRTLVGYDPCRAYDAWQEAMLDHAIEELEAVAAADPDLAVEALGELDRIQALVAEVSALHLATGVTPPDGSPAAEWLARYRPEECPVEVDQAAERRAWDALDDQLLRYAR